MKNLFVCLIFSILISCSLNDDTLDTHTEILPIENAIVPEQFELGRTYTIDLSYIRPSTCHAFKDIYYVPESNKRTIAIVAIVFDSNNNCKEIADEIETSFDFKPTQQGSYIFKFWKGTDANGDDEYLSIEVPVIT